MQELHNSNAGKSGNWRFGIPSYSVTDQLGQVPKKMYTILETRYPKHYELLMFSLKCSGHPASV